MAYRTLFYLQVSSSIVQCQNTWYDAVKCYRYLVQCANTVKAKEEEEEDSKDAIEEETLSKR